MPGLDHVTNGNGAIERFGATVKITDALVENFENRGMKAAQLLLATLTETPYTPMVGGDRFEMEVSNRFNLATHGNGNTEQDAAPDTVDIACEALVEFVAARPAGAKKLTLDTFKTHYNDILNQLLPGRRTPENQRGAYEEAFVEESRKKGIHIRSARQGLQVIKGAPKKLSGLRLNDRSASAYRWSAESHELVTVHGRILTIHSRQDYGFLDYGPVRYYLSQDTAGLRERGGRAPRSTIASEISRRAIALTTRHTQR